MFIDELNSLKQKINILYCHVVENAHEEELLLSDLNKLNPTKLDNTVYRGIRLELSELNAALKQNSFGRSYSTSLQIAAEFASGLSDHAASVIIQLTNPVGINISETLTNLYNEHDSLLTKFDSLAEKSSDIESMLVLMYEDLKKIEEWSENENEVIVLNKIKILNKEKKNNSYYLTGISI